MLYTFAILLAPMPNDRPLGITGKPIEYLQCDRLIAAIEPDIDIEALSTEAGKKEAEVEKEKYTPTQDDLQRLEEELRRVNEQKFGNLTEETSDPINEDQVRRLSYSRRDA